MAFRYGANDYGGGDSRGGGGGHRHEHRRGGGGPDHKRFRNDNGTGSAVLTELYDCSVWPRVLPYCLFNTYFLFYIFLSSAFARLTFAPIASQKKMPTSAKRGTA
jgi:hypothetical protein